MKKPHLVARAFACLFVLAVAFGVTARAQASTPTPSPAAAATPAPAASASPSPSPMPTSTSLALGPLSVDGVFSAFSLFTSGVNATGALDTPTGIDVNNRTDISNAFLIVNKESGTFRYGFAAGAYNIPVVGFALNKTTQDGANTSLYGALPSVYVEFAPNNSFNLQAGKLATMTGQESTYTYEDINIQRGIIWNMEPAVSRGVRGTLTGSKFNGALEVNDGFYSGNRIGFEGQITNTPSSSTTFEIVFMVANASAPPNATASIANKQLLDPMLTYTTGKWTFSPYLLWVNSPKSAALGYINDEHAFGAVFMSTYALSSMWSLPLRVEYGRNGSSQSDTSANANLLGYGPGSGAWTYTLTPTYRRGIFFARAEASDVNVQGFTPGLAFSPSGMQTNQFRSGLEAGVQF
ncbi:MAG: outer membrane beta-barrel protein [Candidatus Eremiobacteraeota bacterium]|nr:outer membrane beta-barrel protein [Candidatus Eremiobacteraeota bacterium]